MMTDIKYETAPRDGVLPSLEVFTIMHYYSGTGLNSHEIVLGKNINLPLLTLDEISTGVELLRKLELNNIRVYMHPFLENMGCCIGYN